MNRLLQHRRIVISLLFTLTSTVLLMAPRSLAQETLVTRCEGDRYRMEVYTVNGSIFLRWVDRQTNRIRRDRIPVEKTAITDGTVYTNRLSGENAVRLIIEPDGDCAARIGYQGETGSLTLGRPGGAPPPKDSDPAAMQAEAERKCVHVAERFVNRKGYFIASRRSIQPIPGGYVVSLRAEQAGRQIPAQCYYNSQTGNIRIEGITILPVSQD